MKKAFDFVFERVIAVIILTIAALIVPVLAFVFFSLCALASVYKTEYAHNAMSFVENLSNKIKR